MCEGEESLTQRRDSSSQPAQTSPMRTCIATKTTAPAVDLLRMVVRQSESRTVVKPDPRRELHGRGAWITPTLQAFEMAEKRRAFQRAFKVSTAVDASEVREYLRGEHSPPN